MRAADKQFVAAITALLTLSVALLLPDVLSAQTTGAVTGCLRDLTNQPLSGATATATAAGNKVTLVADSVGCYEFTELPPNLYRVTARLLGLDNTTRDRVRVVAGQVRRVDLVTRPSSMCECLLRATTLREFFERADAVVYLRITDTDVELSAPAGLFKHTAKILEVFKQRDRLPSASADITFLQDQSSGAPEPYESGEDVLLFVNWWPAERIFLVRTLN